MTLSFSVSLPYRWSKDRKIDWLSSYAHHRLTKNKSFEWQTDYFRWTNLLGFNLDLIPTGDHASIGFDFTIIGFTVSATIYDHRHE